jgi:hypothetical protein
VLASSCASRRIAGEPNKSFAALQDRVMVKRTAPIRVITFLLLAASGALCQRRSAAEFQSLPDAPSSVQSPTLAERSHIFVNGARSPLTIEPGHVLLGPQPSLIALYPAASFHERSSAFLARYLNPPVPVAQNSRYCASTSNSFVGRASYAASRIFVTVDDSGKARVNTRYFVGVLTSVASATAYRPYWARSTSDTLNNFGSTIGSDAGRNVFHEFRPGIEQMVKGLTPKFVSRIEQRITHDQSARSVSVPAK